MPQGTVSQLSRFGSKPTPSCQSYVRQFKNFLQKWAANGKNFIKIHWGFGVADLSEDMMIYIKVEGN